MVTVAQVCDARQRSILAQLAWPNPGPGSCSTGDGVTSHASSLAQQRREGVLSKDALCGRSSGEQRRGCSCCYSRLKILQQPSRMTLVASSSAPFSLGPARACRRDDGRVEALAVVVAALRCRPCWPPLSLSDL
eukprot:6197839-Pleurochrysis_carterae.AAC.2